MKVFQCWTGLEKVVVELISMNVVDIINVYYTLSSEYLASKQNGGCLK